MAKLSKEELMAKVDSSSLSDDEKISFMEDITDSMDFDNSEAESLKVELENVRKEAEDIKAKYKARFLESEEVKEVKEDTEEVEPEMEEKEYVDVKDIFTKKEEDK